jgi:excisionase family DNA binding protein
MSEQLMSVNDAAKRLGVSGQYVRVLEQLGRLTATRTVGGFRIFKASDVEALALERERQKERGPHSSVTKL